jgi:hypothetical protein
MKQDKFTESKLDEVIEVFRDTLRSSDQVSNDETEKYFRDIASGKSRPALIHENAVLAARCFIAIFDHAKHMEKEGL